MITQETVDKFNHDGEFEDPRWTFPEEWAWDELSVGVE